MNHHLTYYKHNETPHSKPGSNIVYETKYICRLLVTGQVGAGSPTICRLNCLQHLGGGSFEVLRDQHESCVHQVMKADLPLPV